MVESWRLVVHRKCLQDLSALCGLFETVSNLPRGPAIFKPRSRGSSTVHRASKHNGSRGPFTHKATGRKSKRSPMSHSSNNDIRSGQLTRYGVGVGVGVDGQYRVKAHE